MGSGHFAAPGSQAAVHSPLTTSNLASLLQWLNCNHSACCIGMDDYDGRDCLGSATIRSQSRSERLSRSVCCHRTSNHKTNCQNSFSMSAFLQRHCRERSYNLLDAPTAA